MLQHIIESPKIKKEDKDDAEEVLKSLTPKFEAALRRGTIFENTVCNPQERVATSPPLSFSSASRSVGGPPHLSSAIPPVNSDGPILYRFLPLLGEDGKFTKQPDEAGHRYYVIYSDVVGVGGIVDSW